MPGKIDDILLSAVASGHVPGVVALAARDDGVCYEGAAGRRAVDAGDPITPDTMLRIASMTKIVTTAAALQRWERGSLDFDAPVDTYRPEFADLRVLEGFDDAAPRLRPTDAGSWEGCTEWLVVSGRLRLLAGHRSGADVPEMAAW